MTGFSKFVKPSR